jgi:anti-anti-sigma regulatory factor
MVGEALDAAAAEPDPHACDYRLVDMSGTLHRAVLAVACDGDGGVSGFLVDTTTAQDTLVAERVNAELTVALESHAVIDQAKGILMLTYGVDEDAAFGILRQSSQRHNVRIRELADDVVRAALLGLDPTTRELLDETLCGTPAEQQPTARRRQLDLRTERHAGEPVLRVSGSVDVANRDEVADAITRAMLAARDVGRITVDVRGTGRIGPAVGEVLTAALRRSAAHGITLTIVGGCSEDAPGLAARSSTASRR